MKYAIFERPEYMPDIEPSLLVLPGHASIYDTEDEARSFVQRIEHWRRFSNVILTVAPYIERVYAAPTEFRTDSATWGAEYRKYLQIGAY